MSVNGIGNSGFPRPGQIAPRDGLRPREQQPANGGVTPTPTFPNPVRGTQAPSRPATSLPVEAPEGTDPALWSVLSSDERVHFAKLGTMGPLTYGRVLNESRSAQLPSVRGGRLDVKI
jgi:hypothetical protein